MGTTLLPQPTPQVAAPQPPRLLDQVAQAARQSGASEPTTAQLVDWVRAYVLFHDKRHPRELNLAAVTRFLEHVVRTEQQPLPALESARSALGLLFGLAPGNKWVRGAMGSPLVPVGGQRHANRTDLRRAR